MHKRDVDKLSVGDHIELKHNLGKGHITKIAMSETKDFVGIGNYPLIQFTETVTGTVKWCTYLMIEVWSNPPTPR